MRYDPATGRKYKVTASDPRYSQWTNHKPSKKAKLQEQIFHAPQDYVAKRAKSAATSAATRALTSVARKALPIGVALGGRILAHAAFLPLAGLTSAAIAAVLLQNKSVSDARLALGQRIEALSLAFVAAQKQMATEYRVAHFGDVPAEARGRLLAGYKAALDSASRATVVVQGGRFGQVAYHTTGR